MVWDFLSKTLLFLTSDIFTLFFVALIFNFILLTILFNLTKGKSIREVSLQTIFFMCLSLIGFVLYYYWLYKPVIFDTIQLIYISVTFLIYTFAYLFLIEFMRRMTGLSTRKNDLRIVELIGIVAYSFWFFIFYGI